MVQSHYKLDLHTHSSASKDGGITEIQYKEILDKKVLDYIAVTDHNRIDFALVLKQKIGERIIVGEEIRTAEGELIGLYLTKVVQSGLSLKATITAIREQGGVVYLPHPFSSNRFAITKNMLEEVHKDIDCIEFFNPRNIVPANNEKANQMAEKYQIPKVTGSDSHCAGEIGKTYTTVLKQPKKDNLRKLLSDAEYTFQYTPLLHRLCPKKNVLKKKFGLG